MIVIVGHGPSILGKGLGSWLDKQTVVRLKRAEKPTAWDWGSRTDHVCATSLEYKPDWYFPKRGKGTVDGEFWRAFYRQFSAAKPSTGLCAIFCAVELLPKQPIGLAGFDNLLHPDEPGWSKWWMPRHKGVWAHDSKAEHEAVKALGIEVIDVCQSFSRSIPLPESVPRPHGTSPPSR